MMDFKNEILENNDISIIGETELIKEVLFSVCSESEQFKLIVGDTYNLFEDYIMLSRVKDNLILEGIKKKDGELLWHESSTLIICEEVLEKLIKEQKTDNFLKSPSVIFVY